MAEQPAAGLSGTDRAAILMLALGEESAAAILRHMGPKEVQKVGAAMAALRKAPRDKVSEVLHDFVHRLSGETALGIGTDDYLRRVLVKAVGAEKALGLTSQIISGRPTKGLDTLQWMDARAVARTVSDEHPQIIAIVLSRLDTEHAGAVLSHLPEAVRPGVLARIAQLEQLPPEALAELDEILERQLAETPNLQADRIDGLKKAADILNTLDSETETAILDVLREQDGELGTRIYESMFVFENLVDIDDRGIQALLREVSSDDLIVALKGAGDAIREKVFNNMSKRAGEMLRDDLEARGPVKLADVERAQKEIVNIARRMAESGEIMIGRGGESFV